MMITTTRVTNIYCITASVTYNLENITWKAIISYHNIWYRQVLCLRLFPHNEICAVTSTGVAAFIVGGNTSHSLLYFKEILRTWKKRLQQLVAGIEYTILGH